MQFKKRKGQEEIMPVIQMVFVTMFVIVGMLMIMITTKDITNTFNYIEEISEIDTTLYSILNNKPQSVAFVESSEYYCNNPAKLPLKILIGLAISQGKTGASDKVHIVAGNQEYDVNVYKCLKFEMNVANELMELGKYKYVFYVDYEGTSHFTKEDIAGTLSLKDKFGEEAKAIEYIPVPDNKVALAVLEFK